MEHEREYNEPFIFEEEEAVDILSQDPSVGEPSEHNAAEQKFDEWDDDFWNEVYETQLKDVGGSATNRPLKSIDPVGISHDKSVDGKTLVGINNQDKAGFGTVDIKKVNQVIMEASKNSRFYQNELRKDARIQTRINEMLDRWKRIKDSHRDDEVLLKKIDVDLEKLEERRLKEFTKSYIHMDMDAFYASVEIRDNPSLRGKPIAIGGNSMLSTSSYEARKYGVRSAMPGFIARKLCPELLIIPVNMEKYKVASERVQEVLAGFDPDFIMYSLDEGSMNVTNYMNETGKTIREVADEIQLAVFEATQLTCSLGGAPNRKLAKLCVNVNKPNGSFFLPPDRKIILDFINKLPIRQVSGIGKVTEKMLNAVGIHFIEDIIPKRVMIYRLFSQLSSQFFMRVAMGVGSSEEKTRSPCKSISTERTFGKSFSTLQGILDLCHTFSETLERKLIKKGFRAKTISIKLKTTDFQILSRSFTLQKHVTSAAEIKKHAADLILKEIGSGDVKIRLFGLRVSHLEGGPNLANNTGEKPILKFIANLEKQPKKVDNSADKVSPTKVSPTKRANPPSTNHHTKAKKKAKLHQQTLDGFFSPKT
eukprot:TRINITY_DN3641_c0_g1_i3.p1 TRINITY_DN3641_c0_g1~~TRINITY_DN3641_c0_g1_i3.p1  ORF type:complete len:592 (+),score=132.28 TRINITY_DN3641_c0_g1_i3:60-1835(+)